MYDVEDVAWLATRIVGVDIADEAEVINSKLIIDAVAADRPLVVMMISRNRLSPDPMSRPALENGDDASGPRSSTLVERFVAVPVGVLDEALKISSLSRMGIVLSFPS